MSQPLDHDSLEALKIAFSYMPKAIEVTRFEYGDVHPDGSPNACY